VKNTANSLVTSLLEVVGMSISRVVAVSGNSTKYGGLQKSAAVGLVVAKVEGKKRSPT
jgi:hypothetical protein